MDKMEARLNTESNKEEKMSIDDQQESRRSEDDDREAKRQRLASVATSQPKPELMNAERCWDHVNGGELDAHEVRKARQLEVDYLNKMRVFERVPYEVAKARMRKEPIKVRWVDTLKGSRKHRSRLMAKELRRGSKCVELVKLIISLVATAQRDPESWFGWKEHGANDQIAMMHTGISRAYFRAPSKEEKYFELPSEMWRSEYPEYGRLRVSLHGTRDAAANWEDAYAKGLTEHRSARGVASPCSFWCKERGIKVVVHGDDFLSGSTRSQLGWLEKVVDKHFEAKHTVMEE